MVFLSLCLASSLGSQNGTWLERFQSKALELLWMKKDILTINAKTVIIKPQKSQIPGSLGCRQCSTELLKLMPKKGGEELCR